MCRIHRSSYFEVHASIEFTEDLKVGAARRLSACAPAGDATMLRSGYLHTTSDAATAVVVVCKPRQRYFVYLFAGACSSSARRTSTLPSARRSSPSKRVLLTRYRLFSSMTLLSATLSRWFSSPRASRSFTAVPMFSPARPRALLVSITFLLRAVSSRRFRKSTSRSNVPSTSPTQLCLARTEDARPPVALRPSAMGLDFVLLALVGLRDVPHPALLLLPPTVLVGESEDDRARWPP